MEYAILFALMGTWIVYRELKFQAIKTEANEMSEFIGVLMDRIDAASGGALGDKGILEIKIHKIKNKGE